MQRWSPEIIRYLYTAADHSRYYQDLARQLGAFLRPEDRVCDAGCGLGLLSRALLPYCAHVTAVDRSPAAVAALRARGEDPKLSALTGDIRELPPRQPYDAMVFCLFGGTEETLAIAARQCGGTALVVRRDFRRHQFSSGVRIAGHTAADMERELQRRGLTYTARRFTLEFGQPFLSLDDAQAFSGCTAGMARYRPGRSWPSGWSCQPGRIIRCICPIRSLCACWLSRRRS